MLKTKPCKHVWRYHGPSGGANLYLCIRCKGQAVVHNHNLEYWETRKKIPADWRKPK